MKLKVSGRMSLWLLKGSGSRSFLVMHPWEIGYYLLLLGDGTIIMAMSGLSLVVKSPHSELGEPFLPVVKVANYWQVCLATLIFRENKSSSGTNVFLGDS